MAGRQFECPGCRQRVTAVAVRVSHRCPARHSRWTDWKVVTDDR